ncbi:hypothetical protein Tco_1519944 [Tanacetum coccineum]
MVVLSNIRVYSDYDFFNGHRMQSGGRKGIRFYLMDMDYMLSTSEWLITEAVQFDVVGFFFCFFYFYFFFYEATSQFQNLLTIRMLVWEKLIQKLRQKEVDGESCVKTCSMNWGEDNSVYTNYIVSSASNGKIQAEAFIFVLVGYIINFMVLEDTTSVIDHDLGSVKFRKPFVEATDLIYDREEGTITFVKDKDKIVFKVPHKMEMFKHIDFTDMNTDRIPPFVIEGDDDSSRKPHYSDTNMMKMCAEPFGA